MIQSKLPSESNRPAIINPQDKNRNRQVKEVQKRIGILGALAKSMAKSNTRV